MYNKKKIATLLVIGMAAMFMMNGCQKKASETETTKQTTAQSEVLHRPKQPQHIPQRAIHFLLIFRILHGWQQRKALRINGHL